MADKNVSGEKAQKQSSKKATPKQHLKEKRKKMYNKHQEQKDEAKAKWNKRIMRALSREKKKQQRQPAGLDFKKLYAEMSGSEDEEEGAQAAGASSQPSTGREKFQQKKAVSRFSRSQWEHKKKSEKKQQKYEEMQKKKQEREAALENYRKKKREKHLKMVKKTPKGQPVMKYRIQHMLEQIEKQYGKKGT